MERRNFTDFVIANKFFLSLVAISYSLDISPAGLTIVLSHQEELISSPSIPRVFSQLFHRSQESPSLFQIYFTRCIQSPRQARKSHNLRQEPLSSFHLRRLPLFSAGTDLHQVDSSSLVPVYSPSMEMTTRVFASPSVRSGHYKSGTSEEELVAVPDGLAVVTKC